MKTNKSKQLFERAQQIMPGGVNSPVRAFAGVGGTPFVVARGEGAYLIDVDGNRYVDYINSWGPLVLGHAHPAVVTALTEQLEYGTSYGASCELEYELAEIIISCMPSIEKIRFVNSGTEACMSALRLARGYTGRNKIVKFSGCYHGHSDQLLTKAGSGIATLGLSGSAGVSNDVTRNTITLPFNDTHAVQCVFAEVPEQIAAIILEPVMGNSGLILPNEDFLASLRRTCDASGSLLIFDEVMTGFRVDPGGAQALYNVKPDLTTIGKVIGGGLPVGAYGGKACIMSQIAPEGPVYHCLLYTSPSPRDPL